MPDAMSEGSSPASRSSQTASALPVARVPATASRGETPQLSSAQLFGQGSEVHIEHGDAVYRLRITSLGKLILTK